MSGICYNFRGNSLLSLKYEIVCVVFAVKHVIGNFPTKYVRSAQKALTNIFYLFTIRSLSANVRTCNRSPPNVASLRFCGLICVFKFAEKKHVFKEPRSLYL